MSPASNWLDARRNGLLNLAARRRDCRRNKVLFVISHLSEIQVIAKIKVQIFTGKQVANLETIRNWQMQLQEIRLIQVKLQSIVLIKHNKTFFVQDAIFSF